MTTTGHEDEFRQLFAEEAEERFGNLSSQLLALEDADAAEREELVASIFREAHTLKGGAAVVGLEDVAAVAHTMETLLVGVRDGARPVTVGLVDGLLAAVDGLRALLPAVIAGEDGTWRAAELEAALQALDPAPGAGEGDEPDAARHETGNDETREPAAAPGARTADGAATPQRSEDAGADAASRSMVLAVPEETRTRPRSADADSVRVPLARLDEIVRLVGESAGAHLRVGRMISDQLGVDASTVDEIREMSRVLNELQELAMRARMVPVATITEALQRAVRDVARTTGKDVGWEVRGEDTELDRGVLQQLSDPLLHMVRNAVDHGIELPDERLAAGKPVHGTVRLHAMQLGSEVILTITDDGRGIDVERVRAEALRTGNDVSALSDEEVLFQVFRSGFSTASFVSDISGRGVGLDVVRANVEGVRGRLEIRTEHGQGTEFRIIVPITLAVLPCLLVVAGGRRHAIPMHSVVHIENGAIESSAEGRAVVWLDEQAVSLSDLATTLGLPPDEQGPVVLVKGLTRRHAFRVGGLIGQRDVVVKGLSRLLPRLDVLAGASVEPDGSILLVVDVPGLIAQARLQRRRLAGAPADVARSGPASAVGDGPTVRAKLLVVDDAMTVRELQRAILERSGYEVVTAVDGVDAMSRLADGAFDLVLTDVEMPRMDGFALTEAIRGHASLANVPVLILTSRSSDEDRQRGLLAGADGYIVKSAFDEAGLLAAVERLLGR